MYSNVYQHTMTFKNPLHRGEFNDASVQMQIKALVANLNNYYDNASRRRVKCKKYFDVSFGMDRIFITLETENPLPNPKRKGQCMRQLSVFLLDSGYGQYLTKYDPRKLLTAA